MDISITSLLLRVILLLPVLLAQVVLNILLLVEEVVAAQVLMPGQVAAVEQEDFVQELYQSLQQLIQ
jgi:hypothetical protein